jgi:hypothetical protein
MDKIFKTVHTRCKKCNRALTKEEAERHGKCSGKRFERKLPQTRTELVLCVIRGEKK